MKLKLSEEETSWLIDMVEHPGWRVFEKLQNAVIDDIEGELLRITLTAGKEVELAYAKARAEGAKKQVIITTDYLNKARKRSA